MDGLAGTGGDDDRAMRNAARVHWTLMSRSFKALFVMAVLPRRKVYRWLFSGENGDLRRVGEHVLADLRSFCGADKPTLFNPDPIIMARRLGRREVFDRIIHFLNLDEAKVQQLMELDDGH